jgi:hypothetical protein
MNSRSLVGVRWLVLASVVLLGNPATHAQEGRGGRGFIVRTPEPGSAGQFRFNWQGDTVKGAPYSAEVINESTQTLADGNRIVRRSTSRVYRDAEGRVRREEDQLLGSPAITITDPVAGTSVSLDTEHRIARQNPALGLQLDRLANSVELARLTVLLNGQPTTVGRVGQAPEAAREQRTEEKLSGRTIEGVWAEGVRRITTIAAGAIGNERPITVVSEEWTSPDLKMLVLSENTDPRVGKTTYKVVNIVRNDPAPSLFQVPADYTVQAGGGRGARSGAPR